MVAGVGHDKKAIIVKLTRDFRPRADCPQETVAFLRLKFQKWGYDQSSSLAQELIQVCDLILSSLNKKQSPMRSPISTESINLNTFLSDIFREDLVFQKPPSSRSFPEKKFLNYATILFRLLPNYIKEAVMIG